MQAHLLERLRFPPLLLVRQRAALASLAMLAHTQRATALSGALAVVRRHGARGLVCGARLGRRPAAAARRIHIHLCFCLVACTHKSRSKGFKYTGVKTTRPSRGVARTLLPHVQIGVTRRRARLQFQLLYARALCILGTSTGCVGHAGSRTLGSTPQRAHLVMDCKSAHPRRNNQISARWLVLR